MEDIRKLIDSQFTTAVLEEMSRMQHTDTGAGTAQYREEEEEFEEIILDVGTLGCGDDVGTLECWDVGRWDAPKGIVQFSVSPENAL